MTNDKEDNVEDILNELGISGGGFGLNREGGKEVPVKQIVEEQAVTNNEIIRPQERKPVEPENQNLKVEHSKDEEVVIQENEKPKNEIQNRRMEHIKENGATAEIESDENTAVAMLMEIDGNIVGAKGVFGHDGLQRTSKVAILDKVPEKEKTKQIGRDNREEEKDDRDR